MKKSGIMFLVYVALLSSISDAAKAADQITTATCMACHSKPSIAPDITILKSSEILQRLQEYRGSETEKDRRFMVYMAQRLSDEEMNHLADELGKK